LLFVSLKKGNKAWVASLSLAMTRVTIMIILFGIIAA
jgi:hypothetical protein